MLYNININFWAVLVAAVVNIFLGMFWYSPALFGNVWMKLSGISKGKMKKAKEKGMEISYLITFVGALIMSYILAMIVGYSGVGGFIDGVKIGFWVWLGFIVPVLLGTVLWEGKDVKLYIINVLYYLVSLVLMGGILGLWR